MKTIYNIHSTLLTELIHPYKIFGIFKSHNQQEDEITVISLLLELLVYLDWVQLI